MPIDVPIEERILILAPQGRDADVIRQTLSQHGLNCLICAGYAELMQQLHIGAGAALITEEGSTAPIFPCCTNGWKAGIVVRLSVRDSQRQTVRTESPPGTGCA